MGQSRPLFLFIFVFSTRYNLNWNWKKHRWCAWDSNPGRQDGRSKRIHWAMAAPILLPIGAQLDEGLSVSGCWVINSCGMVQLLAATHWSASNVIFSVTWVHFPSSLGYRLSKCESKLNCNKLKCIHSIVFWCLLNPDLSYDQKVLCKLFV